jgi:hypothetical protein
MEKSMKNHLLDLVGHTHQLGTISTIKITGTDQETKIDAIADDKTVVVQGRFLAPIAEFIGLFGMPNLSKLNVILNIPEYQEDPRITLITRDEEDGTKSPAGIHFENKAGDFKNDYRFMSKEIVNEQLRTAIFRGAKWAVEFSPTAANIQRFRFQAQANNEHSWFTTKTEGSDLKFYFGEASSHAGNFVFQPSVSGSLNKQWRWPVAPVMSILSLVGDKTMRLSDEAAMQITVNSGIAEYNYTIPALTK